MEFSSRAFSYDALMMANKFRIPLGILYQVSEISVIRGGEIEEHIQYCDEITYAISGKARFYSGDKSEEICGGQIHYVKEGIYHKIVADDSQNFNYICIGFKPDQDNEEIKSFIKMRDKVDSFIKNDDGSVRRLTSLFLNEFYLNDDESMTMIKAFLLQILICVARIYEGNANYIEKKNNSKTNHVVYNVLRYIDKSYMYITSVQDVAKALSYSECYLSHIFSEALGIRIKEYIIKKKLQAATEMLKTSNISIEKLSECLNFNSAHTFRQAFKKMYSISPSEYRKMYSKF